MKIRNEVEVSELYACPTCKGRGGMWVRSGQDDVDMDICDNCEGTGFDPSLGLYWCDPCYNYHCEIDPTFASHWPRQNKVA